MGERQLYNQLPEAVQVSWSQLETRCQIETSCRQRALRPSVTHSWPTQPRWGRSAAMVRRTLGQNNSLSPSPAHLSHTTNINPFKNKVWEIYFYKEVCLYIHWSSYIIFVLCICMWLYNIWRSCWVPVHRIGYKKK